MLLSITLENWMSFRDRVTFSMIAGKERQHGNRVTRLEKYQTRILPIAAIYGGNASGKTNFFKAISFAKSFITKGTQPESLIPVESFGLNNLRKEDPTFFAFELLIHESIYELSFEITKTEVITEKLVLISSSSEKVLYERKSGKLIRPGSQSKDMFLEFAFRGTRDNQLFLTNAVSQKVEEYKPVYDWFKNTLELIAPDSRFEPFELFFDQDHPTYSTFNEMLHQLDTGIIKLDTVEVSFENAPFPESLKVKLQQEIKEGTSVKLRVEPFNERYVITRKDGNLTAKKLVSLHSTTDGSSIKFDIRQESDGSQRIIDLLPAFIEVTTDSEGKVYVIDEIDRSLHTLITRKLLDLYLAGCSQTSRSQVFFTTHDVLLMDQQLLRRDEMWITERNLDGVSSLISFSEYKDIRYDKDIRKSYLQGRLGGIPRIILNSFSGKQVVKG